MGTESGESFLARKTKEQAQNRLSPEAEAKEIREFVEAVAKKDKLEQNLIWLYLNVEQEAPLPQGVLFNAFSGYLQSVYHDDTPQKAQEAIKRISEMLENLRAKLSIGFDEMKQEILRQKESQS